LLTLVQNPHDWIDHIDIIMSQLEHNMIQFLREGTSTMKLNISQALLTTENAEKTTSSTNGEKQTDPNNTSTTTNNNNNSTLSPSVSNLSAGTATTTEQEGSQIILPFVNTVQIFNDILSTVGYEKALTKEKKNILKRMQNVLQGSKDFNQEEFSTSDTEDTTSVTASNTIPTPQPLTIHTDPVSYFCRLTNFLQEYYFAYVQSNHYIASNRK
jgi:hypothetical protein